MMRLPLKYVIRRIVALALLLILIAVIVYAALDTERMAKPMNVNGDYLGRNYNEGMPAYIERANASLDATDADGFHWALITFKQQLDPVQAARVADEAAIPRVSSIMVRNEPAFPVPEPVAGAGRDAVFALALQRLQRAGIGVKTIEGLVVYASKEELVRAHDNPAVLSVDVAPAGAVWGRFGVKPVLENSGDK